MDPFIGEIKFFAGNYIPEGWMECNGAVIDIPTYQALFTLIGTTYGGDGRTTFALPDMRGRLPVGQGTALTKTNYPLGSKGGSEQVALDIPTIPQHTHTMNASPTAATSFAPGNTVMLGSSPTGNTLNMYTTTQTIKTSGNLGNSAVSNSGNEQVNGHANIMPSLVLTYIICAQGGLYPTQN